MTAWPVRITSKLPGRVGDASAVALRLCVPGVAGDGALIRSSRTYKLGGDGTLVLPFDVNAEIQPAGTWWEALFVGDDTPWPFTVPAGAPAGGTYDLAPLLTEIGDGTTPGPIRVPVTEAELSAAVIAALSYGQSVAIPIVGGIAHIAALSVLTAEQTVTLPDGLTTFVYPATPPGAGGVVLTSRMDPAGTGAGRWAFPAGTRYAGHGIVPIPTNVAGAYDKLLLWWDGAAWSVFVLGLDMVAPS